MQEMNCWEFEEYVKDNILSSSKFIMTNNKGGLFLGNILDSSFGMVKIDQLGEGFIRFKQLRQIEKENNLKFTFMLLES